MLVLAIAQSFCALALRCVDTNGTAHFQQVDVEYEENKSSTSSTTCYMDGCFDMMHSGHFNAIRQAARICDKLVVGIHSDWEIYANKKRPTVTKEAERYALLEHIKWIDRIEKATPYSPTLVMMNKLKVDFVVHGDDMPTNGAGQNTYYEIEQANKLKIVKRTEGVSTTDFVSRLLARTSSSQLRSNAENEASRTSTTLAEQGVKLLLSTHRILEFAKPWLPFSEREKMKRGAGAMELDATKRRVIYVDGAFDMFHVGHAATLQKAKNLNADSDENGNSANNHLIVGLWDDAVVENMKGGAPVATLHERLLCVSACKYVDDVIIGAAGTVSADLIRTLGITKIVVGTYTIAKDQSALKKRYAAAFELLGDSGVVTVDSEFPNLDTDAIAARVLEDPEYKELNVGPVSRQQKYLAGEGRRTAVEA